MFFFITILDVLLVYLGKETLFKKIALQYDKMNERIRSSRYPGSFEELLRLQFFTSNFKLHNLDL